MTNEDVEKLGFNKLPHFTIDDARVYYLPRNRYLSIGCVGTPNEILIIGSKENDKITDIVVLHNYDYDGYITKNKLESIVNALL